jgi:hypothetical protein
MIVTTASASDAMNVIVRTRPMVSALRSGDHRLPFPPGVAGCADSPVLVLVSAVTLRA